MRNNILIIALFASLPVTLNAQHPHHPAKPAKDTAKPVNKSVKPMPSMKDSMNHHDHDEQKMSHEMHESPMSHAFSLNLPMKRNGSGTGWLPDASPMFGNMYHSKKWMYMLHYNLFLRYTNQDIGNKGSRGDDSFDAPNWIMLMGQRKVGDRGLFHFNTMFSLDPITEGGDGYPLLFQSGEVYKGNPLVDRQHPHDLFAELSVSYSHAFSKKSDLFLYLAYPGEPALGATAFMHRPSALNNPDAPLSHHWIDATHITFGVATVGFRLGKFKIEGSSFTGREPNEKRFDFDKPRFDSWSGRLSYNPNKQLALQVSHGFLKSPEELHSDENVHRTTASAIHSVALDANSSVNTTAVWGMNKTAGHRGENAFLLESAWKKKRLSIYGRYEFVEKSGEELNLDEDLYGNDALFPVNAVSIGASYDLLKIGKAWIAAGTQATWYRAASQLDDLYGKNPMALQFYLRLYPGLMRM